MRIISKALVLVTVLVGTYSAYVRKRDDVIFLPPPPNKPLLPRPIESFSIEYKPWTSWGRWSECDCYGIRSRNRTSINGLQKRFRGCEVDSDCPNTDPSNFPEWSKWSPVGPCFTDHNGYPFGTGKQTSKGCLQKYLRRCKFKTSNEIPPVPCRIAENNTRYNLDSEYGFTEEKIDECGEGTSGCEKGAGTVYGVWSQWFTCDNKCLRERQRCCDINGFDANICNCLSKEGEDCTIKCIAPMNWESWSEWSECTYNPKGKCHRKRTRSCVLDEKLVKKNPMHECKADDEAMFEECPVGDTCLESAHCGEVTEDIINGTFVNVIIGPKIDIGVGETFDPESKYPIDSISQYTCDDCRGVKFLKRLRVKCRLDEEGYAGWAKLPKCKVIECNPKPKAPKFGSVDSKNNQCRDTVNYACDPCYDLVGSSTITCIDSIKNSIKGTWSDDPPKCKIKSCGPLLIENAIVNGGTNCGDTLTYTCVTGFELVGPGSPSVKCTTKGWETPSQVCVDKRLRCPDPGEFKHGNVTGPKGPFRDGDTLTFTCDDCYEFEDGTSEDQVTITCTADGTWNDVAPTCKIRSCGPLQIKNGDVTGGNNCGDTVEFTCDEGFETNNGPGPQTLQCTPEGWEQEAHFCRRVGCPDIGDIENGEVTGATSPFLYEDNLIFTCDNCYDFGDGTSEGQ
ncbi:unnamed protein product, partial [Owenia fusiformis]